MKNEVQIREIIDKVLSEEGLKNFIKIFEKEHNLFRGTHDKIALPETLDVPQTIVTQIVEKFETELDEGSIPFIDENGYFSQDNDDFFWDAEKEILCIGLNSPETDMVKGFCMRSGTPPTVNIEDTIQAYASHAESLDESLTDGGVEEWTSESNLMYWFQYNTFYSSKESVIVHGGSFACKLQATSSYTMIYQNLILPTAGSMGKVSIWFINPGGNLNLVVKCIVAGDFYLQADGSWTSNSSGITLPVSADWQEYSLSFSRYQDEPEYTIYIRQEGSIAAYVDDISLAEVESETIPCFRTSSGTVIGLDQDLRTISEPTLKDLTITTPVNIYDLSHDLFADSLAGEHFTMLDEDDLVSDSDMQAATQQSIKAYVDSNPGQSIVSNPPTGEYRIKEIRLDSNKHFVVVYDETPIP